MKCQWAKEEVFHRSSNKTIEQRVKELEKFQEQTECWMKLIFKDLGGILRQIGKQEDLD